MARLHLSGCSVDVENGYVEHRDGTRASLTTMERQLLSYLRARPRVDVSHDELLREVWQYAPGVNTRAAYFTARRLRAKIEEDPSQPRHLLTAHGVGYRFVPQPDPPEARNQTPGFLVPEHTNLAAAPTDLFGRREQLDQLRTWLAADARLVTLTGPGGTGKTRLATELGLGLARRGTEVWFCDLSEVTTLAGLVRGVARVLAVPVEGAVETAIERVGNALRARERVVLILDNFEQVVHLAEASVTPWTRAAPEARVLVTSREPLSLPGERVLPLGPLEDSDALALIQDRVQAAGRELPAGAEPILRDIARQLDGLPLALELVSARLAVLSPDQVRARLLDRFRLLEVPRRGRPSRHQTLHTAIDWSWQLLTPFEQAALAQCATFRGGFGLDDAQAVIALGPDAPDTLDVVQALVDRSMIRVGPVPELPGALRFALYLSIQEFAWEKLQADLDAAAALARHAQRMAEEGARLRRAAYEGRPGALRRLVLQAENLEAALSRTSAPEHVVPLALALAQVLASSAPLDAVLSVLDRAVQAGDRGPAALQIAARWARGNFLLGTVQAARALPDLEVALQRCDQVDDGAARAQVHLALARYHLGRGAINDAAPWMERAVEGARGGDPYLEHDILQSLLHRWLDAGDFERGTEAAERIQDLRDAHDLHHLPVRNLSVWLHRTGRVEEEREALRHDLAVYRSLGQRHREAMTMINLAVDLVAAGDREAAPTLLQAIRITSQLGLGYYESLARYNLATVHLDRGELDAARRELARTLDMADRLGHLRIQALAHLGGALLAMARDVDPGPHAEAAVQAAEQAGDAFLLHAAALVAAVPRAAAGEPVEPIFARAADYAERFDQEQVRLWVAVWGGLVALQAGDPEPARAVRADTRVATWIPRDTGIRLMVRELERRLARHQPPAP